MGINRRLFLQRVAASGGYGAAYSAMDTLGLLGALNAATTPTVAAEAGRGQRLLILGGGIAGLVCAYELERAGFQVTLLEARDRLGGRNWTLRNGSKIEMAGEATQAVSFPDGVYMNAGPARIPSQHEGLLSYCRKLHVALEVEVNSCRNAYLWAAGSNDGKPVRIRQAVNDTRGYVSELLAKAVNKGALDGDLTVEDKEKLLPFLRFYGDLTQDLAFQGTDRSGMVPLPGAANRTSREQPPLPFRTLLGHRQLDSILFEDDFDMQATMLQPVGGMDRIPAAFERAIKSPIVKNAEVVEIGAGETGVRIAYRERDTGRAKAIDADYAIVTLPPNLLARIDSNFSKDVKAAIASFRVDFANKIGFEAPRFWEREQIYGGISFVDGPTRLIWYPSNGFNDERGVLLGCYGEGPAAESFAAQPLQAQIAAARAAICKVHPGHERDLTNPAAVNWSRIPFSMSAWPYWGETAREGRLDSPGYRLLNEPQQRVHFAGAYLTQLPGWQEGAVFSAQRAITAVIQQATAQGAARQRRAAA